MDVFGSLLSGFLVSLQPANLGYTLLGVFLGTVIGILPGIGPSATIALLLPITYGMSPTSALIMLAGIFYGARYGGSTTSILIRTPGEASSMMTSIDGYQMALKGRGGAALAVAAIGSFIAGTMGLVGLILFAVPLTDFALRFGPAEYFMLMVFAMSSLVAMSSGSPLKGIASALLGLMIATIGIDQQSGRQRFTMGVLEFQDGIDVIVVIVGLFALSEVLRSIGEIAAGRAPEIIRIKGSLWLTAEEWRRSVGPIWRGGLVGFIVGILPGAGGAISAIMSYTVEKRLSPRPEEFGKGAIEGVAGPEAANNADTAGAMVPLLTLGLPGGGTTAILLSAFVMFGIQPGPFLFRDHPDLVWGLITSMFIGNVLLLILNLPLVGLFVRLLYIPNGILFPLIVAVSVVGVYALDGSVLDLYLLLLFGVIGYVFDKVGIPVAPLVLALVLGTPMEKSFRQALTLSDGDPSVLLRGPICISLFAMAVLMVAVPLVGPHLRRWKKPRA
ncbi:MAG: tripartite tricarboxylate transporter permease [Rhodospirillales bacterium]|jgi:putative tricarboxylic transport membrane protein